ncbi:MAG: 5-formyltetrahydrofolate cyclo-ligase [Promethearchaeati archaeon SRVP18_Atabeyarchaeia-1]
MGNGDVISRQKQEIRRGIWSEMERANVARFPKPVYGRIPNFEGADLAAQKIREIEAFKGAKTVFCCPDSPQRSVRSIILKEGKTLVMASPRLREDFVLLNPDEINSRQYAEASTISGAFKYGERVGPSSLKIDFKVTGSVAVTVGGGRVGKGGGYSDLEYALLREFKCIAEATPIATTVHDLQVVVWVPMDPSHDMPLDYIATPTRLIETRTEMRRPRGISWGLLSAKQIREIPLLRLLEESQQRDPSQSKPT